MDNREKKNGIKKVQTYQNVVTEINLNISRKTVRKELGKKNKITTRMNIRRRRMVKNERSITRRVTKKVCCKKQKVDEDKENENNNISE